MGGKWALLVGIVLVIVLAGCSNTLSGNLVKQPVKQVDEMYTKYIAPKDVLGIADTQKTKIIDLRDAWIYNSGHVPKSISIPYSDLSGSRLQAEGISKEFRVILYDDTGTFSESAYKVLLQFDYPKVQIMQGGYKEWVNQELLVEQSY